MDCLRRLTALGALQRYPQGLPEKIQTQLDHELGLIDELGYAMYFITVYDIVKFAIDNNILCHLSFYICTANKYGKGLHTLVHFTTVPECSETGEELL